MRKVRAPRLPAPHSPRPLLTPRLRRSLGSGKYQTETGQTACDSCAAGSYSAAKGSTACELCAAGGYCDEPGADSPSVWTPCEPGRWSNVIGLDNSSGCVACGEGTHQGWR